MIVDARRCHSGEGGMRRWGVGGGWTLRLSEKQKRRQQGEKGREREGQQSKGDKNKEKGKEEIEGEQK